MISRLEVRHGSAGDAGCELDQRRRDGWPTRRPPSDDGLVISTDKDDYQPGDTVFFSGSGWPANDTLDIMLQDEPRSHEAHTGGCR